MHWERPAVNGFQRLDGTSGGAMADLTTESQSVHIEAVQPASLSRFLSLRSRRR